MRGKPRGVRGVIDVPRPVVGGGQHRLPVLHAQVGDPIGADRHGLPAAAPLPAVGRRRALDQAARTISRKSSAPSARPVSRSRTSATPVSFSTRRSRGNTSVARLVAAGEDEERRAERGDGFEADGAAGFEAGEDAPAHALAAGAARQRQLAFDRSEAFAGCGRGGERIGGGGIRGRRAGGARRSCAAQAKRAAANSQPKRNQMRLKDRCPPSCGSSLHLAEPSRP